MTAFGRMIAGGLLAIALVVAGLACWQNADRVAAGWSVSARPVLGWAVACGAVAIIALGQVSLVTCVVEGIYPRDSLSRSLRLGALLVFMFSLVSAVALAFAGR